MLLQKQLFLNHFNKSKDWLKILSLCLVIAWMTNFIFSGSYLSQYLYTSYLSKNPNFNTFSTFILSFIFCLNLLVSLFSGRIAYYQDTIVTLLYYPISRKSLVFLEVISESSNLVSLIFFTIYGIFYFLTGNPFSLIPLLFFLPIYISFIFFTCGIIHLIKTIFTLFAYSRIYYLLRWLFPLIFSISVIYTLKYLTKNILNSDTIYWFSSLLEFFPPGIYAKFLTSLSSSPIWQAFAIAFLPLFLFNCFIYFLSCTLSKRLRSISVRKYTSTSLFHNFIWPDFYLRFHPIARKSLLYFYRSPKRILNLLAFFSFYIPLLYYLYIFPVSAPDRDLLVLSIELSYFLLHGMIVLLIEGNFLGYDYSGVINYFFLPITIDTVILQKSTVPFILVIINAIFCITNLLLVNISFIDLFFYNCYLIFTFIIFQFFSIWFSISFPLKIDFYQVWGGINTILSIWLISIIIILVFSVILYVLLIIVSPVLKSFISLIFLSCSFIIYAKFEWFLTLLGNHFYKQKEKIISELQ